MSIDEKEGAYGLGVVGYFYQNNETGLVMSVDTQQVEWGFDANNPRLSRVCALADYDKAQRLLSQLREELAQRDAEVERLNGVVSRLNGGNAELCSRVRELEHKMDYYKALESQAASVGGERDREADRKRFPDPLFNKWLDESITDNGEYSVWHQVGDTCAAWHGWDNRQFYVDHEYAELRARAAISPAGGGVEMPTSAELLALSQECEKMKGGRGMHYLNYAREVLHRWGSKPQANSQEEI